MINLPTAWRRIGEFAPPERRIYVAGCSGESQGLVELLGRRPDLARDATFLGVWIPGVNRTDYASLHETAYAELVFQSPDFRPGAEAGRSAFRPLSYVQAWRWLASTTVDVAFALVSPPGADGQVSLGVAADFTPALLDRSDVRKVAIVSEAMPAPRNSIRYPLDAFDLVVDDDAPLLSCPAGESSAVFEAIGANVASLIDDGDTLQFGLGNVQFAALRALSSKRNLRIHSGMISDPVRRAVEAGAIAGHEGAITTGVAIGERELYDFCRDDPRIDFHPVRHTHAIATLAAIHRFVAINSVIEVDLLGQANAEFIGGRQVSGAGGLVDFLRGAAASPGGKPVLALASTAKGGATSRIVPMLTSPAVSVARADVAIVVTEHGIADLRGRTVAERAEALIGVAAPHHKADLRAAWTRLQQEL